MSEGLRELVAVVLFVLFFFAVRWAFGDVWALALGLGAVYGKATIARPRR